MNWELDEVERPFVEQLTAMGWRYVAGDLDQPAKTGRASFAEVVSYVRQHGSVRRSDVADLCRLTSIQARDLLKRLRQSGRLQQHGERRAAYYVLGEEE